MKMYSSLALATVAAISFAAPLASAHDVDSPVYFQGTLVMSEITVEKDGATKTYDVPQALASKFSMSAIGDRMGFGAMSKCAPYLGKTVTELRHKVTDLVAFRYVKVDDFKSYKEAAAAPTSITVVIPKGSDVVGTCGKDGKTLTELGIDAPENARIVFDEKP